MSISNIFKPKFVCVLTNESYKNISNRIFIVSPGSCPRSGTKGHLGAKGVIKKFKHGHVAYQIDVDDEQNRLQVTFLSKGKTCYLGVRSKGQISLTCQFQRFLNQNLCVFSQIKDRKHIEQNFHSFARFMPRDGTGRKVKNFSVGIRDGAPSTAHS